MNKTILHIDINAFFAYVEKNTHPELKDKPIMVGGHIDTKGKYRGVVSTCCYIARKYGIRSGMPYFKAVQLCPEIIALPCNFSLYREISMKFFEILRKNITHKIEIISIDECFLDCSYEVQKYKSPIHLANYIKKLIFNNLNLTINIGISWNKDLAKIASEYEKPNGITLIDSKEKAVSILSDKNINIFTGIGLKIIKSLNMAGIYKVLDLFNNTKEPNFLLVLGEERFNHYKNIFEESYTSNIDSSIRLPKSISSSNTFDELIDDVDRLIELIKPHVLQNFTIVNKMNLLIYSASVILKDSNFIQRTKSKTWKIGITSYEEFQDEIIELLKELYKKEKKYRLIGVSINNIKINQNDYFNNAKLEVKDIINKINNEYENSVLFNGYLFYLLQKFT